MNKLIPLVALLGIAGLTPAQTVGNCPVFPADNIWNTRIDQLPVHPSSSTWVNTMGPAAPLHPDFGSGLYQGATFGFPYITVPGTQTLYPATFLYQSESDPGPYAIPLNAPIENGSAATGDRHVISIDVDHCILYEFYLAYPQTASWQAGSGAIFNLLSNALRPATWTSADAAGLPIFAGIVRHEEVAAGAIRHAIRFSTAQTQMAYVWPARHYASTITSTQYPPMGARFRLKASFDISGFSPANQVILTALKQYGMILADNGGAPWHFSGTTDPAWDNADLHALTTIAGSNFEAVDTSVLMVDPNSGQAKQAGVNVSVGVSPATASVQVDARQQFTAVVTGNSNQAVTWDVNGAVGGNGTVGFIDSISGIYTAPALPVTVTVHATSNVAAIAIGSASITVVSPPPPPPPVTPPPAAVPPPARRGKGHKIAH